MRLKNSDRTIYLIDIALLVALAIYTQLGSVEQIFRAHFFDFIDWSFVNNQPLYLWLQKR